MKPSNHQSIAVIGAGVIGLSWCALFVHAGYKVRVLDPRENITDVIRQTVPGFVRQIPESEKVTDDEVMACVTICSTLQDAVKDVVAVQENGPENTEFKVKTFAEIEKYAPANALLMSSSSGIPPGISGQGMQDPSRLLVGHPFNPPHIVPLVEICPGEKTHPDAIKRARQFYQAVGKRPAVLNKPVYGFVANRLQEVLFIEAVKLVDEGVVSMQELDNIVTSSIGIRWASVGPLLAFHIGGGDGGLGHIIKHIGKPLAEGMGLKPVPDDMADRLSKAAFEAYPKDHWSAIAHQRDDMQEGIIELQKKHLGL